MSLGRTKRPAPRPVMNVTPLVDVVLVLLIIFMIVIPAMDEKVKIELPGVVHADPPHSAEMEPFLISLTANGGLFLDNERLPADRWQLYLTAAHRREPTRRLVLKGDVQVPYAKVRALMKVLQDVGFPGVALRVNEKQEDDALARR